MTPRYSIIYVGLGHLDAVQWRGTHRIASALSRLHRVLFVELDATVYEVTSGQRAVHVLDCPLRRRTEDLFAFTPVYWLPFSRRVPWIGRLNERTATYALRAAVEELGLADPILWIDDPWRAHFADVLPHRLLVYNVLHEYAKYAHRITDDPRWARTDGERSPRAEIDLLRRADLVFCVYQSIRRRRLIYNPNCYYMPHGVDLEAYQAARQRTEAPPDLACLPRPIVGHLGGVNADLTDFDLIRYCAGQRPDWSFVFIGKHAGGSVLDASRDRAPEARLQLPNIHFLGERPHHEVPAYVTRFDVCWITYALNEFIRDIETMKIYEYLAAGRPTLIPRLPQLAHLYGCTSVFDSAEDALRLLDAAVAGVDPCAAQREAEAQKAAYSERAAAMTRLIEQRLAALGRS